MGKPVCVNCRYRGVCRESGTSWIFFFIGIIATVALRGIEPVRSLNPMYATLLWYVGVAGFLLFFVYKYRVLVRRSKIIRETGLVDKLVQREGLSDSEYELMSQIVCSQDNQKERINFFVIFALSAVALIFALVRDVIV